MFDYADPKQARQTTTVLVICIELTNQFYLYLILISIGVLNKEPYTLPSDKPTICHGSTMLTERAILTYITHKVIFERVVLLHYQVTP